MRRPALVIVVLAAAALFFGWETYKAWTADDVSAEGPAAGIGPDARPDAAADNVSRDADLPLQVAVIVNKPLFRPDRQPFVENAAVARRSYEAELSRFSLVGVLLQGEERKGLVLTAGAGRQERWEVGVGDTIPGFTVKEVLPDGLTLAADGREFLLPLYAGGPKGQGAGAVRTELAPGIPAAQTPGTKPVSPSPNVNIPGAVPMPMPPVAQPPGSPPAQPQTPVYMNGGRRGYPRPARPYPPGQ